MIIFSRLIGKITFYWLPVIIYMYLIFYLSSIPGTDVTAKIFINDKILHGIEFFILAVLLYRCFNNAKNRRIKENRYILAISLAILYAVSDEFHQSFVPGRAADIIDVIADSIGAVSIIGLGHIKMNYFNYFVKSRK
ncbi:VanZ family protein [Candidatus Woesearchaeota archaeon]|nr:VanZ family protein [Candidatus Woesearchaeota archaeon]